MKTNPLLSALFVSAFLMTGAGAIADEKHSATENKTEKKSSRRKKVEMCKECGKPEIECECEDSKEKKHKEEHKAGDQH